ncbi:hypothetical protein [Candidatus Lokiarchaeum ossiferum]
MDTETRLFDEPVRYIENQIVEFFVENVDILKNDSQSKLIYAYYLIHHKLSKDNLIILTGFDPQDISSSLKVLVKMGCIRQYAKSESTYVLEDFTITPISFSFVDKMLLDQGKVKEWRPRFRNIKQTLVSNVQNINILHGYYAVYTWVVKILDLMPGYDENYIDINTVKDRNFAYLPFSRFFTV